MSRQNSYEPYHSGKIQDIRLTPGYIPAYNRGNQSGSHRNLIPGRKRQFNRVYHDPPNNTSRFGSSNHSRNSISDENRPREYNHHLKIYHNSHFQLQPTRQKKKFQNGLLNWSFLQLLVLLYQLVIKVNFPSRP